MPSPACWPRAITATSSIASRREDFTYRAGRLTIRLAREFGFCYGVDRAVDYAYQTRRRFPDRAVFLTGEIIHNPHVNDQLRAMGIGFLSDARPSIEQLGRDDVVILPAFGVTVAMLQQLEQRGCTLDRHDVRVGPERLEERPALRRRRLYVGHPRQGVARGDAGDRVAGGRATAAAISWSSTIAKQAPCATTSGGGGDRDAFLARFGGAASPASIPIATLQRIGLANQTTMLMSESLEIGEMLKQAMLDRYGAAALADALPGVRHHLQCHAGSPGRRRRAARTRRLPT